MQADRIASVLRWWRDAGVDVLVDEAPRRWLEEKPVAKAPAAAVRRAPVVDVAAPPAIPTFEARAALVEWLMTSPAVPEGGSVRLRVPPSGDPSGGLMVLADFPEPADSEAGHLLAGDLAALFDRMLAAIGADRAAIYLASLCPARPARGRLDDAALAILGPLGRRHVELVAPQRLWIMGAAASRAILGVSDIQAHGKLHAVNLNGVKVNAVVTAHPRFLTDTDKKRRAWSEMQRLIVKEQA